MFEKVKSLILEELNIAEDKITEDALLKEDLGVNSIDFAELIMEFEDEFDIEIDDSELRTFRTVGDIVRYLEAKSE